MNLRFIHNRFELDLSNYSVSIVEENNWFSDRFFSRYTFPVDIYLTPELNAIFGDLLSGNSSSTETYFNGEFYYNDRVYDAVFDIEEQVGLKASVNIRFGLEEIPNYDKQLSALPLEEFDLVGNIYDHAETIITQTYPAVNYNFVMAHTNQIDVSTTQWEHFQGIINKRVSGAFVENEFDAMSSTQYNRNVMIPQPYIMHVLKTGIEDAGYIFAGDFQEQPEFKKAVLSELSEYYTKFSANQQELLLTQDEAIGTFVFDNEIYGNYSKTITLSDHGRYKIAGNLTIHKVYGFAFLRVKIPSGAEYNWEVPYGERGNFSHQIDFNFDFYSGPGEVEVYGVTLADFTYEGTRVNTETVADLTLTQIAKYDASGNLISTLVEPTKIKLNECVPKMTFGELLDYLKNHKNIDIDIIDKTFYINSVNSQLEDAPKFDLTAFEIKEPLRRYTKGDSFVLQFKEISSEEYSFSKLLINNNGLQTDTFVTDEKTTDIVINGIPLPLKNKDEITTADHFLDDKSIPKIILYDGSVATNNVAEDNSNLLLPHIYNLDFATWLAIRIFGKETNWNFVVTDEQIRGLYVKNHIFAYRNYHIIKTLNKDLLRSGLWNVEIELKQLL